MRVKLTVELTAEQFMELANRARARGMHGPAEYAKHILTAPEAKTVTFPAEPRPGVNS